MENKHIVIYFTVEERSQKDSTMPNNDKDLLTENEFDGQKPTEIQSVQKEIDTNQNQKRPSLELDQSDLTVDNGNVDITP